MKRTRKWLSLLLALVMLLSCLPMQAMADGGGILSTASDTDTSTGTPENPARPDNPEKPDDYEEPANTTSGTCGENLTWELDENDTLTISGTCGDNTTWKMNIDGTLTVSGSGEMDGWPLGETPWFDYSDSITSVVIEDGVTRVGVSAFWGCENLTHVIIPGSVTRIDYFSFACGDNLTAIMFEGDAPTIADGAFEWVTATAYYPADNATWKADIMQGYGGTLTWTPYTDLVILEQPKDVPVVPSGTVDFAVAVHGDSLKYEWWVAAPGSDNFEKTEVTESTCTVTVDWDSVGLRVYCVITDGKGNTLQSEIAAVTQLPVMYEEETVDVVIDKAGEWVYYSFTPNYSCKYLFDCYSNGGLSCSLYDSDMILLAEGVSDSYFMRFSQQLQTGKTYIFAVRFEDETITGDASVTAWISHNYDYEVAIDATCTTDGVGKYTCIYCTDSYTETIPAAHNYVCEIVTEPTCTACGQAKYTCSGCSDSYMEVIPVRHQIVDGTCSACGLQACGENVVWSFDEATGRLTISGTGAVEDCVYGGMPWFEYTDKIKSVVIEDGVTGVGVYAFCNCSNLTDVVLPDSLSEIANGSFAGTGLTRVEIPDGVTAICDNAFAECKALNEICFSESVTTIGELAFVGCDSLETVVLPASITEINGYAFMDCANLCRIEFLGSVPQFGNGVFADVTADAYYPAGDATWTPEMMEYLSGNLTWYSSDGKLALFRLSGSNVALGSSLAMNFFIKKEYLSGSEFYAVITHYDHDDIEDGCHVYTIPFIWWEEREDYMVVTLENLAAKNMIDYVEVQVFRGDGTPCTAVWGDSVQNYAMRIFNQQDAKTKTLLVDMLNYGAAAQTYFGYRDTYLVNECLTEEQQAYASQSVTCADQRVQGENYFGSTLVLENRIQLTMYFRNITADMYAVVIYTDHDGNEQEFTINGNNFAQYNANIYGVTVDTLAVADGDQLVTVTVYDADGNAVASASDTVNGYLSRMMSGDVLFEAIAAFTHSAYEYFHQN